jgi:hypothetical protein
MRHRKIWPESLPLADEDDEEEEESENDSSGSDSGAVYFLKDVDDSDEEDEEEEEESTKRATRFVDVEAEVDEDDAEEEKEESESDEDMGYALFEGGSGKRHSLIHTIHILTSIGFLTRVSAKKSDPSKETGSLLQRLIALQSFEGSWSTVDDLLCAETKIDKDAVHSAVDKLVKVSQHALEKKDAYKVLCTAIMVIYFEKKMAEEVETWELVVEKARTWIEEATGEDVQGETWKLAESIVGA